MSEHDFLSVFQRVDVFLGAYSGAPASLLTGCLCSGLAGLPTGQAHQTHAQITASSRDPLPLVPRVMIVKSALQS